MVNSELEIREHHGLHTDLNRCRDLTGSLFSTSCTISSATFCEKNLGFSMIFKNRFVKRLLGFWFFGFLISSMVDARAFLPLYGGVVTFETENRYLFGPFLIGLTS